MWTLHGPHLTFEVFFPCPNFENLMSLFCKTTYSPQGPKVITCKAQKWHRLEAEKAKEEAKVRDLLEASFSCHSHDILLMYHASGNLSPGGMQMTYIGIHRASLRQAGRWRHTDLGRGSLRDLGMVLEGFGGGRGRGRGAFFAPNARIRQERDPAEVEKERALRARAVLSDSVKPVMVGWSFNKWFLDKMTRKKYVQEFVYRKLITCCVFLMNFIESF